MNGFCLHLYGFFFPSVVFPLLSILNRLPFPLQFLFTSPIELCSGVHRRQWHISQHMVFRTQDIYTCLYIGCTKSPPTATNWIAASHYSTGKRSLYLLPTTTLKPIWCSWSTANKEEKTCSEKSILYFLNMKKLTERSRYALKIFSTESG